MCLDEELKMKHCYIILLKNNYLLFSEKKPKKAGNYVAGVKLFELKAKTSAEEILTWTQNEFEHPKITEVTDWQ